MGNLNEGHQWLFLLENIRSEISEIEIQWGGLKVGMIQELNLMGKVPMGYHKNARQELQDYIDSLSD